MSRIGTLFLTIEILAGNRDFLSVSRSQDAFRKEDAMSREVLFLFLSTLLILAALAYVGVTAALIVAVANGLAVVIAATLRR